MNSGKRHRANDSSSTEFIMGMLDTHSTQLAHTAAVRRSALALIPLSLQDRDDSEVVTSTDCVQFMRRPDDRFVGCSRLRTAMAILSEVDQRGFERRCTPCP